MSRLHRFWAGVSSVASRAGERLSAYRAAAEEHREREEERLLDSLGAEEPSLEPAAAPASAPAAGGEGEGAEPPAPAPPAAGGRPEPASVVPWGVRVAAEASWRLLVMAGVLYVLMRVISAMSLLVTAFSAGLLITALLEPTVSWLRRRGMARGPATALTFVSGFVAMGLIGWFVVWQVIVNTDELADQIQDGIEDLRDWLLEGPIQVSREQINDIASNLNDWIGENSEQLTTAGLTGVTYIAEFLTGAALAAFVTLFLLYDGRRVWTWSLAFVPGPARDAVSGAGPRAWLTLTGYVRGTVIVALIDAVGIGLGLYFLDVPLAVPLAVIVFVTSFIPIIGATLSGSLAVIVALVTNGVFTAALVLGVVLIVQQVEGNVLQPLILGRMVRVHPLAVVITVTGGGLLAGIPGAVVAVPLVAVLNTVTGYLRAYHQETLVRAGGIVLHGATAMSVTPVQPAPPPPPSPPPGPKEPPTSPGGQG